MSWEDEVDDWETAGLGDDSGVVNQWAGEDEDEDALADGWDDDEDDKKKKEEGTTVVPGAKKLTKRQLAKKKEEEEKQKREAREALENVSEEEKARMKEIERRRIEKEELKMSSDLFGDMGDMSIDIDKDPGVVNPNADADNADMAAKLDMTVLKELKKEEPKGVQDYVLKGSDDFKKFAEEVGSKVASSVNTSRRGDTQKLVDFLKIVISKSVAPMSLDEANDVKKHFNTVYNNKAKDPSKKKKAPAKKNTVKMSGGGAYENYGSGGGYHDNYDEFDF